MLANIVTIIIIAAVALTISAMFNTHRFFTLVLTVMCAIGCSNAMDMHNPFIALGCGIAALLLAIITFLR